MTEHPETPKERTPKEKYDDEMKEINHTISPKTLEGEAGLSGQDVEELDEECEAVEEAMEEVDKSMGNINESTMTQDQHLNAKIDDQRNQVLKQFTGVGAKQERLSPDQQSKMTRVLELVAGKKIKDPVLLHLVNKKLDLAKDQAVMAIEVKEMQLKLIKEMSDLADKSIKANGAAEHYNRDILLYVQKNPTLLAE